MKHYLILLLCVAISSIAYELEPSWALLAREAVLAFKDLRPEDEKFQKILATTAVGLAMMPIMHRAVAKVRDMVKTQVGVIEVTGGIFTAEQYIKQLHEFKKNPNIAGVLLKIDSPGGSPGAAEAFHNELKLFRETKPVVALVENICASAAYYIASAADYIIANPSSIVGSIGVYMPLTHFEGLPKEFTLGFNGSVATINDQTIQAGEYKRVGNPFKPLTDKERAYMQNHIDEAYEIFTSTVADNRGFSLEDRATWAEGRIFNGKKALSMNLIDEVGSISNARIILHHLITKKGGTVRSDIRFVKPRSFIGTIMNWIGLKHSTHELGNVLASINYQIQQRMKQYKSLQNLQTMS